MILQIISILFLVVISAGQFILAWMSNSESMGKRRWILLVIFLLSVGLTIYSSFLQEQENQETEEYNERLLNEVKKLKGQHNDLLEGNLVLSRSFHILKTGQDTILAEVRTNNSGATTNIIIPASETQLAEVEDRRTTSVDLTTGLHLASFVFRSRNVIPLRDIRIEMTFNKPVVNKPSTRIYGAFVTEQGTCDSLVTPTQYVYRTGYLSQSNDIIISITSKDSIQISNLEISP